MLQIGDKIRYIGRHTDNFDLTYGKDYEIIALTEMQSSPYRVRDDVGDGNNFISCEGNFEASPTGRTFVRDNRDNPKLHEMYVGYALETLGVIGEAIEALSDHSRVDSSLVAGALCKERARLVREDAAYFEAAAILYVGKDWLDNETV